MREQSTSSSAESREAGSARRRSETSPWSRSRSRRRAAAYADSVDHMQGLMAMRTR